MTPLCVTATIAGQLCMPERPIALDALLAAAVAMRDNIPPPLTRDDVQEIDIPVQRSDCGRYWLVSQAVCDVEVYALRYLNKRAPVEQYQTIGSLKITRVDIGAGVNKSYRIPMETMYPSDGLLTWWCLGDADAVRELLALIHHLGKKRSVGMGIVQRWTVEPCETWPGFPVMRDGFPLRSLPIDTRGLSPNAEQGYAVLSPPYWRHEKEELCALPQAPA